MGYPACDELACAAGSSCGFCLRTVASSECPNAIEYNELPRCFESGHPLGSPKVGGLCKGYGECGTNISHDMCRYGTRYLLEVYQRMPCFATPSSPPQPFPPPNLP